MNPGPKIVLETERLLLRDLTLDDLDMLAAIYSDPQVRQYFPEGTLTRAETKEELEWIIDVYYARYGYGLWATILKETGELIGRCGLLPWQIEGRAEIEVAYLLAQPYWGRGLGSEAARAIAAYAFNELNAARLICLVDPRNAASINVARKIGMALEREGDLDGWPTMFFAMSRPGAGGSG